jgi:hypothetical protein
MLLLLLMERVTERQKWSRMGLSKEEQKGQLRRSLQRKSKANKKDSLRILSFLFF